MPLFNLVKPISNVVKPFGFSWEQIFDEVSCLLTDTKATLILVIIGESVFSWWTGRCHLGHLLDLDRPPDGLIIFRSECSSRSFVCICCRWVYCWVEELVAGGTSRWCEVWRMIGFSALKELLQVLGGSACTEETFLVWLSYKCAALPTSMDVSYLWVIYVGVS